MSSVEATDVHVVQHGKHNTYNILCTSTVVQNHFIDYLQAKALNVYLQFQVILHHGHQRRRRRASFNILLYYSYSYNISKSFRNLIVLINNKQYN